MKRIILLLLCLSLVVSLIACSSHPFTSTEAGEYPTQCIRASFIYSEYEININETVDKFPLFIPYMGLKHEENSIEHIDVEFTIDYPDVVEIVSYDVNQLLNNNMYDGLTFKGKKSGVATITMTFIYKPTGGRSTPSTTIITVVDPAETAE